MATPQWCRSVRHPLASLDLKTSGFSTRYSGGADKRLLFRHSLERCLSLQPAHCFGERRPASSRVAPSCLPSGCQSGCQWAGPARPNVYPSRAVVQRDCRCVRDGEPAGERCEQHRPGSDSASIGWADAGLCLAPAPPRRRRCRSPRICAALCDALLHSPNRSRRQRQAAGYSRAWSRARAKAALRRGQTVPVVLIWHSNRAEHPYTGEMRAFTRSLTQP